MHCTLLLSYGILRCMLIRILAVGIFAVALAPSVIPKAELKQQTLAAFQSYTQTLESQVQRQQSFAATFLSMNSANPAEADLSLRSGEIVVRKADASPLHVPGGLIHHWTGAVLVPGVTVPQVVVFMQNYNDLARYYQPEVMESKLLAHDGDNFRVELKLRKHEVLTVTFNTISNVHYGKLDAMHQWSASHMDSISENSDVDHGLLWRMNTYWRFVQTNGGVILECEVVTLTRDIPSGLGWVVSPFISSVPRESLEFTLEKTRQGMVATRQQLHNKER